MPNKHESVAACLPIVGRNLHRNKLDAKFPSANSVWQKAALWPRLLIKWRARIDWLSRQHMRIILHYESVCTPLIHIGPCARTGAHLVRIIKLANTPRARTPPSIKLRPDYARLLTFGSAAKYISITTTFVFSLSLSLSGCCFSRRKQRAFGDCLFLLRRLNCKAKFGARGERTLYRQNAEVSVCLLSDPPPHQHFLRHILRRRHAPSPEKTKQKIQPISRQLLGRFRVPDSDPLSRRLNLNSSRLLSLWYGDDRLLNIEVQIELVSSASIFLIISYIIIYNYIITKQI